MGFIKEPDGVDFIINSGTLSDSDRVKITQYVNEYKLKMRTRKKKVMTVGKHAAKQLMPTKI